MDAKQAREIAEHCPPPRERLAAARERVDSRICCEAGNGRRVLTYFADFSHLRGDDIPHMVRWLEDDGFSATEKVCGELKTIEISW